MDLFDLGTPIIMAVIGLYYFLGTPRFKDGAGFKTQQSLRGKAEWSFGHKFLGLLFIVYALIAGFGAYMLASNGLQLQSWLIVAFYTVLLVSTIPLMNVAIQAKFGKSEKIEAQKAAQAEAYEEQKAQYEAERARRKKEKEKAAQKKKQLKEQQKIAKQRKKGK